MKTGNSKPQKHFSVLYILMMNVWLVSQDYKHQNQQLTDILTFYESLVFLSFPHTLISSVFSSLTFVTHKIFMGQWHVQSYPFETSLPEDKQVQQSNAALKEVRTFHVNVHHQCLHRTCTSFFAPSFSTLSMKFSNCSLGNNL